VGFSATPYQFLPPILISTFSETFLNLLIISVWHKGQGSFTQKAAKSELDPLLRELAYE